MGDFEEKLNGILNNPREMEKIMALARNFMGNGGGPAPPPTEPVPPPGSGATGGGLDGLLGGLDSGMMQKLAQGFAGGLGSSALLTSITPHLRDTRQGQLKRAIMIAQMVRVARGYFSE